MDPSFASTFDRNLLKGREILALKGENSVEFLERTFELYRTDKVFAICRDDTDLPPALGTTNIEAPAQQTHRGWARLVHTPRFENTPAQVVFSSGTEGKPKAIVLSHRNLGEITVALNHVMEVTEDIREYIGVPVTYSFGLGRARAVAAAGGSFFLPERFDVMELKRMLEAGEVNAISAVPSLWSGLLANADTFGSAGHAVRWIEIGSQYMSAAKKLALTRVFPNARILMHYGLSEASRSCFLDISAGEQLDSVGRPIAGADLRITDSGAIAIRGPHVAMGKLAQDGTLQPLQDEHGWLVTGDEGEIHDGWLYFKGRLDDQINISGIKLSAETLEQDISALVTGVAGHIAAASLADPDRGEIALLAIEADVKERASLIETAARMVLERKGIPARSALKVICLDALPRTGTGKLRRKALPSLIPTHVDQQADSLTTDPVSVEMTPREQEVLRIWKKVLGPVPLHADQSFYDGGGDSLSAMQIGLSMEAADCTRQMISATLEGRTLREVALLFEEPPAAAQTSPMQTALPDQTSRTWAINLTRGIMVLSVLVSHWGDGFLEMLGFSNDSAGYLNIFYRMGTPGFAMVFGLGIGFAMLVNFDSKRESVLQRSRASFLLVLTGLVLLAIIKMILQDLQGYERNGYAVSRAFFSPLSYYAIALGLMWLWLPPLAKSKDPFAVLIFTAPLMFICWELANLVFTDDPYTTLMEWVRRMSTLHYSIFKMGLMTTLGLAAGYWFAGQVDSRHAARRLVLVGSGGAILFFAITAQAYGLDSLRTRGGIAFRMLPGLLLYACLALVMLGLFQMITTHWATIHRSIRVPFKMLIAIGMLSLPIYVFHGLVLPSREILAILGLPGAVALGLTLGSFLLWMGYAGRRVYRMYV